MIRETSIEAYNKIKENGLLSQRRWQIYDILFTYGPLTGSELAQKYKKIYGYLAPNAGNIVTRLGELRNTGSVKEVKKTICSITGMKVILWDCTSKIPIKLEKKKLKKCCHCNGTGYLNS